MVYCFFRCITDVGKILENDRWRSSYLISCRNFTKFYTPAQIIFKDFWSKCRKDILHYTFHTSKYNLTHCYAWKKQKLDWKIYYGNVTVAQNLAIKCSKNLTVNYLFSSFNSHLHFWKDVSFSLAFWSKNWNILFFQNSRMNVWNIYDVNENRAWDG